MIALSPLGPAPQDFGTFLRFLRRRVRITQRELGLRVGYSEGHVCRLEQNQRVPELSVIGAVFVPALGLSREPALAGRLMELAGQARGRGNARPTPAAPDDQPRLPPMPIHLIQRQTALAGIQDALSTEPIVVVRGLAGSGKTTLMAQYARARFEHEDVFWITVVTGVSESPEAFLLQLAHQLARRGRAGLSLLIENADGPPLPLQRRVELVIAALAQRPTLLCVDNAQALTGAGVLTTVAELGTAADTRLLLASRKSLELLGAVQYRLGGLEQNLSLELIERLDPGMPPALAARLAQLTGGNPMLLRLALGQTRQPGANRQSLIEGLTTDTEMSDYLLRTMLDDLSPTAAWLADLLSVLRHSVDLYDEILIEHLSDGPVRPDLPDAISELQRRQLIDQPAAAELHPLVQSHTYARLTGDLERRRALHLIAAAWSEQHDADLEAVWHFYRAGEDRHAIEILTARHHLLVNSGQGLAAADLGIQLRNRLQHQPGTDSQLLYLIQLVIGNILRFTIRWPEAEAMYRDLLAADVPPAVWAMAAARLASCLMRRGQVEDGLKLCQAAVARLDDHDHVLLRAELTVTRAQALLVLSKFDEARQLGQQALSMAKESFPTAPDPADAIAALAGSIAGTALAMLRQFEQAVPELRAALDRAERTNQPALTSGLRLNLAILYLDQGDFTKSEPLLHALAQRAHHTNDDYLLARVEHSLAHIAHHCGDYTRALTCYDRARELKQRVGDTLGLANTEIGRSTVLRILGRVEEALAIQRDVLSRLATVVEPRARAPFLDEYGMTLLVAGEPSAAQDQFHAALETLITAEHGQEIRIHQALACLVSGNPDQAIALAADDLPGPNSRPAAQAEARLLRAALALTRHDAPGVAAVANELAAWVAASGFTMYSNTPALLLAAAAHPPPPIRIPELLWVARNPDSYTRRQPG